MVWDIIEGGITSPAGFLASSVHAGIKPGSEKDDLGLLFSTHPADCAAIFTKNRVVAAPVMLSRENLKTSGGRLRAIIVNSGNANACTGSSGVRAASEMAGRVARELAVSPGSIGVASTGVIGVQLPLKKVTDAIPKAVAALSPDGGDAFANAILTTDTRMKTLTVKGRLGGRDVTISGCAKGSGMIHPRMATMLAFITTDASASPQVLKRALVEAAAVSFNCVTVDGDTSTNDSLFLMANGASGSKPFSAGSTAFKGFADGVAIVCRALSRQIAADGEGATKLVEVEVRGARTPGEADLVGRAVANSPLVKTAMAGGDANWGRIICAAGYSGANVDPDRIDIDLCGVPVCKKGAATPFNEKKLARLLEKPEVSIRLSLNCGRAKAVIWTCDMTEGYIRINGSYRT